jgi:hypothetical protein
MAQIGKVKLTHPLAHAVVTVHFTGGYRVRLWLIKALIRLAVRIGGGELHIKEEE